MKRLMLLAAVLLITILAVVYGGIRLFKGIPEWYRRPAISAAWRELLAQRAFNKFANIQNAAALARRDTIAGSSDPSAAGQSIVVSFTDDELNAFFEKWASYANWKSNYERYVKDPVVIVQESRIVLAGEVRDLDAVVSLQLDPRINSDGKLDLRLERIMAGRLPLPDLMIQPYQDRLTASLRADLPRWQQRAAIDSDGAANSELISAVMARLFMHVLNHTAADPVLFLPLVERHANVPVRVNGMKVEEHTVTMMVRPLNAKERGALLERVRGEESAVP
jgi:uncharacterized protein YpmS